MPNIGTRHLRISKQQTWDNRKQWLLSDINIGNYLHKHNADIEETFINRNSNRIPLISVYEFQPSMYKNIAQYVKQVKRQFVETYEHVVNMYRNGKKAFKKGKQAEAINKLTSAKSVSEASSATEKMVRSFQIDYDKYDESVFIKPIRGLKSSFNGKYIRSYQMPFNEFFINADGKSGWTNLKNSDIDMGSGALNKIFSFAGSFVDAPLIPNWVSANNAKNYYNFVVEFKLVNNNIDNLISNFSFLSELYQGTMWMQYDTFRVPPNIYSVEIPGFTFIQYASIIINVNSLGAKRMVNNTNEMRRKFKTATGFDIFE